MYGYVGRGERSGVEKGEGNIVSMCIQGDDGIRVLCLSRGLGDMYKRREFREFNGVGWLGQPFFLFLFFCCWFPSVSG